MARSLRHYLWLAVAFIAAPRPAAAQAEANVVTTLPEGTVGGTPKYLPQTVNLVAVLQEFRLTKLDDKAPAKVACPSSAPGVDCYELKLPAGETAFKFEYADSHGIIKAGSVAVELSAAPLPPIARTLSFPAPRGCPSRAPTVLEHAYREAVIKSKLTGHDCDEPATFYERSQDTAILLFDETGTPIGPLPTIDEDDRVFIVVAADQNPGTLVKDLRVVTCDEPQQVRVGGSAKAPPGMGPREAEPIADPTLYFKLATASACSSNSGIKASLTTVDKDDKTTSSTIAVPTLSLYRITLGLGVVYDVSKETEFRAESVKGESVPQIVQDDHTRGLATLAMVSLRLERVDTERARVLARPLSWISPTVGVSLTHPTDHIYAGLLLDPVPGLGFVVGMHFRREPTLARGYQVGDRVPGDEVATDKRWRDVDFDRDYFAGLNLDAAVIANILKGLAQ
jgi:hypothetical protein